MSQVIVITGMHRSGTSLLSSVLASAGVHVGDQLIAPNSANPRGYFEDVDFYEFHEQLLHSRKQSYLYIENDFLFQPDPAESEHAQELIAQRVQRPRWGWKDPRTCLFLDFWRELLPEARFVFVYRHPLEVLLSLVRRGEFDRHPALVAGLNAWRIYNLNLLTFFDRHPRQCLLVHIDSVVNNFQCFSEKLPAKLQLDVEIDPAAFECIYHAPELQKTPLPAETSEILAKLFPGLLELYQRLNSTADLPAAADSTVPSAAPDLAALAQWTASLPAPVGLPAQQSMLQLLVSQLAPDPAEKMLRRYDQCANGLQQRVDRTWLHAQQLERLTAGQKDELQQQHGQLETQHAVLQSQQIQLAEQDAVLRRQAAQIGSLQADIARAQATPAWKLMQSVDTVKKRWSRKRPMAMLNSQNGSLHTTHSASIPERISQIRQLQAELRTQPVTGSLRGLKKMVFQITRSTFSRQFRLNTETVDLIEIVYRKLERERVQLQQQSLQMQDQAHRIGAPAIVNGALIESGEVLASCGQTQDQARINNIRPLHGFNNVYTAPAEMRMPERIALYSLIFGMQPKNCLEVGTFRGGSSAIICGAMDDTGFGRLACVDPMPKIDPELWSRLSDRCQLFTGPSPEILTDVARQMGTPFDFALIDANHTYEYVRRDIAAVLPLLADQAHVLFHDAHYGGVRQAIDEAVAKYPEVTDCGLVSVEPTVLDDNGQSTTWAGLRLLRYQRRGAR